MRIYEIEIEHVKMGLNWRSKKVWAKTFNDAVKKASLRSYERITSVDLLETTESN